MYTEALVVYRAGQTKDIKFVGYVWVSTSMDYKWIPP